MGRKTVERIENREVIPGDGPQKSRNGRTAQDFTFAGARFRPWDHAKASEGGGETQNECSKNALTPALREHPRGASFGWRFDPPGTEWLRPGFRPSRPGPSIFPGFRVPPVPLPLPVTSNNTISRENRDQSCFICRLPGKRQARRGYPSLPTFSRGSLSWGETLWTAILTLASPLMISYYL